MFSEQIAHSLMKQHGASRKNGLRISFYVFLPFLILLAIIAFKQNKLKIFQNKDDTVSEEKVNSFFLYLILKMLYGKVQILFRIL